MKKVMNIEMKAGKKAQIIIGRIKNALTDGEIHAKVRENDGIYEAEVKFGNQDEFETVLGFMKNCSDSRTIIVQ
jgi:hypothetical protein